MSSDFIEDRGPAEYFHGRQEIIDTFTSALERYLGKKRGTTFLIQGAPGAGKTALLDKLSVEARAKNWDVAIIKMKDLYDPISMAQSLGESYVMDKQYAANVGIHGFGGGYSRNVAGYSSVDGLLKEVAPEEGLILVLDEAQRLINLEKTPTESHRAGDTLDKIHNGGLGKPVMLLTAGLGTTQSAFRKLGISRFAGEALINLGRLDKKSERLVIRDWLIKDGGAKGNPDPWIDAIAKETHGWPQHIISYVKPAVAYLESNHRRMTDEGLRIVLEKGNEFRINYYETRAHEIDVEQRQSLTRSLAHVPLGGTTTRTSIIAILNEEYPPEVADNFFKQALEQGIIDKRKGGYYGVPIPSMQTWLIEEYGREQIQMPKIHDELSKVRHESPKQEKDSSKWSMER